MNFGSNPFKLAVLGVIAFCANAAPLAARDAQRYGKLYGDADRGAIIFSTWCAACHSVGNRATDRAPDMQRLLADPAHTDGVIRAFLAQPHRPMPPLELGNQQIEDIIAYLHELELPAGGQSRPSP